MCDKMAISAYILNIVEKDPFLCLQMRAKEMFNRHQFFSYTIFLHKQRNLIGRLFSSKCKRLRTRKTMEDKGVTKGL